MIGSIASNAQRHELTNGIISKTLDNINYSAATFGTAMKASYNFQQGVLDAAYASEPLGFDTSRQSTGGRMSTVEMQPLASTVASVNASASSGYDFQRDILGSAYLERGTGGVVSATA